MLPVSPLALAGLLVSFGAALSVALLILATRRWHAGITADSVFHLPQKIHLDPVSRVGGIAIVAGFVAGLACVLWLQGDATVVSPYTAGVLLLGLVPVFLIGLAEDVTKRVAVRRRLFWIAVGSAIVVYARKLSLQGVDTPLLDPLFDATAFALAFSVFACVGLANAYNIVDGLDGLLGGIALITLAAVAWVAMRTGDDKVLVLAALLGAAVLGWLPLNWPRSRLFAGDGGAYALGFVTAAILLLLVLRHPQVSPWLGLSVAALPVWETLYSIWRRFRRGAPLTAPDRAHLHQLVRDWMHGARTGRSARPQDAAATRPASAPNGACSPLLWAMHGAAAALGALCYDSTFLQVAIFVAFATGYVVLHGALLRARDRRDADAGTPRPADRAPAVPGVEPGHGRRPRLLVLTPRYPYPVIGGDRLRIYEVCRSLSRHADLTLLSFCETRAEMEHVPDDGVFARIERVLLPRWRSRLNVLAALPTGTPLQLAYYRDRRFAERVDALLPGHDGALAHLIRTGQYLEGRDVPTFLEMTDAISLNYSRVRAMRTQGGVRAIVYAIEAPRLLRYERATLARFDAAVLVSRVDRDFLLEGADRPGVLVCSNGIDLGRLRWRPPGREPHVAFIGNLTSMQNMDAALHFATDVLPRLRALRPVRFRVIGRIGERDAARLRAIPGVDVTGEVPDVAQAAAGCIAGACPVRLAAGVQNKVLEYMALGLPVITTTVGIEGIDAPAGETVLVADTPETFAACVERVISDRAEAVRLSLAGRRFVEAWADWNTHLQPLVDRILDSMPAIARAPAPAPAPATVAVAAPQPAEAARPVGTPSAAAVAASPMPPAVAPQATPAADLETR